MGGSVVLYECHAHLFMNGEDYARAAAAHRETVNEALVRRFFAAYQAQKIGYVRDGGDKYGVSAFAKDIAAEYDIDYVSPVFAIHKKGRYGGIVGRAYTDRRDYTDLVLQAKAAGADFIKLMYSGILNFDVFGALSCPSLEAEEIREMVDIAHEQGLRVMAHVNGAEAIKSALRAGTDSIEHGFYMDEDCLYRLAESDTVWVPTVGAVAAFENRAGFDAQVVQDILALQMKNIRKALELGALLAVGSDGGAVGVPHGMGAIRELELLRISVGAAQEQCLMEVLERGNRRIQETFRRDSHPQKRAAETAIQNK